MNILLSVTVTLVFSVSVLSGISAAKGNNARELFEKKCSVCHSLGKVTSKTKNARKWEKTVMRMNSIMERKGKDSMTQNEIKTISDYLVKNYGK